MSACNIAGLRCKLLLCEPTAAAIAYGLDRGHSDEIKNCLIFDFGGGTFDVSVMTLKGHDIKVKSKNGDNHLGGQDIDNLILDFCIKQFEDTNGINVRNNVRAKARIRKECTLAKTQLTVDDSYNIIIDSVANEIDLDVEITRS